MYLLSNIKNVLDIFTSSHIQKESEVWLYAPEIKSLRGLSSDGLYFLTSLLVTYVPEEIGSDFRLCPLPISSFLSFTLGHL